MAVEHVEISEAQKTAADKKFAELMASEKPEDKTAAKPAEGENDQESVTDDTATGDAGAEVQDKKIEPASEGKTPEKKDEKPAEEVVEEPPVDEADAIAAQEALLSDTPSTKKEIKDKDKTPLAERAEWKKARLRIDALEKANAELLSKTSTDVQAPKAEIPAEIAQPQKTILTPAAVEAQISEMDKDWNDGKYPEWDFARLEREKLSVALEARMMAKIAYDRAEETKAAEEKRVRDEQMATTARIDKAIEKTEILLPGLKEAFTALAKDKMIGPDPVIGQAIMQNLDKGGLHVAYYLRHHREFALGLLELPIDERAAKLYDLRVKLTRPRKTVAVPTDFKPDKPIVNSYIPDKGEKEKNKSGDSDVEAEIKKARTNRR